jgi:hypothetical protein
LAGEKHVYDLIQSGTGYSLRNGKIKYYDGQQSQADGACKHTEDLSGYPISEAS